MRRRGTGLGLLTAALVIFAGCQKDPFLRPPKPPDQLIAPPVEEARYSQPPEYPKNVLNEDRIKKPGGDKDAGGPGTMPRGGMNRPGGPTSTY
jgi:hypothetical protein